MAEHVVERGIEYQMGAPGVAADCRDGVEQARSDPVATRLGRRDEIVDIDEFAADQVLLEAVAGDPNRRAIAPGGEEAIARGALARDPRYEFFDTAQMRPQQRDDRKAGCNLRLGLRMPNGHIVHSVAPVGHPSDTGSRMFNRRMRKCTLLSGRCCGRVRARDRGIEQQPAKRKSALCSNG